MKTKKLLALTLAVLMLAGIFAGCASKPAEITPAADTSEPAAETQQPAAEATDAATDGDTMTFEYAGYTFTIDKTVPLEDREIVSIFENVSHPFGACLNAGVEQAAADFGVNAYQMGGTSWNAAESVEIMDALVTKGVDVICIAAIDEDAFTAASKRAMEAGVMVIGYNSPMTDTSARLCHVGVDIYSVAYAVVEPMCKAIYDTYGGGKVLLFGDLAANEPYYRAKALRDCVATYPEGTFEIIELNSNQDDATIYADIENAFQANPDIVGTYSVSGCQYLAGKYLKENNIGHLDSDHPIYNAGHDLFEDCLYNVRDGWEAFLVSQDPFGQGYQPIKIAAEFFTNYDTSVFEDMTLEPIVVTKDNVQEYIDKLEAGIPVG